MFDRDPDAAPERPAGLPADASVLVLNDHAWVNGGASKVAIDEAIALAEAGLDVTFVAANGPIDPQLAAASLRVVLLDQPELLDVAKAPGVALQAIWNRAAARAVRGVLAEKDVRKTVVHLHGYTKALGAAPIAAAKAAGARTVCTLHDFFAACPNGAFFDYREGRPCGERALSFGCLTRGCDKRGASHKAYRVVRQAAQRYALGFPGSVDAFVTLSAFSAEKLRPYLPAGRPMHALPNVIEARPGPRVDVTANTEIVAVGRLDVEKGVRPLIAAAAKAGVVVTFVGDGPLRADVDASPSARATGWVDAAEVRARLAKARCLVFPSLWYEAFGLVVDEAAALGVPSIVSDVSAASERVEHAVSGVIARGAAGDPARFVDALAHAIRRMADPAFADACGEAAYRRFWAAPPTRARHARGLMEIYARVLADAAAPNREGGAT